MHGDAARRLTARETTTDMAQVKKPATLNTDGAAKLIGISRRRVQELLADGSLKGKRGKDGAWSITPADAQKCLRARTPKKAGAKK